MNRDPGDADLISAVIRNDRRCQLLSVQFLGFRLWCAVPSLTGRGSKGVNLERGLAPRGYDPLLSNLPAAEAVDFVRHVREVVNKTALAMPAHRTFVATTCAGPGRKERKI